MRNEMRDEIAKIIDESNVSGYGSLPLHSTEYFADRILALIDAQRCVWKKDSDGAWLTSCQWAWLPSDMEYTFCPCCGKRIEVKEGEDART